MIDVKLQHIFVYPDSEIEIFTSSLGWIYRGNTIDIGQLLKKMSLMVTSKFRRTPSENLLRWPIVVIYYHDQMKKASDRMTR